MKRLRSLIAALTVAAGLATTTPALASPDIATIAEVAPLPVAVNPLPNVTALPDVAAPEDGSGLPADAGLVTGDAGVASAPIPDPGSDLSGWFSALVDHGTDGEWIAFAALAVIGLVWLLRTWGKKHIEWLKTRHGGLFLVGATTLLLELARAQLGGGLGLESILAALAVAAAAMGARHGAKRAIGKISNA